MKDSSSKSIVEVFGSIEDPRSASHCSYPLPSLLFIALCTLLSKGEDYTDMAEYAKQRIDWLRQKVEMPEGCLPSHDTFNRLFQILNPSVLESCLGADGQHLLDHIEEKQLCLDGKKLRGASPGTRGTAGLYILNAWVAENHLSIGQKKVGDKSNEITAIPELLKELEITGSTVTIDAIGCQTKIADLIIDKGADYLLAVKGNQAGLLEEIEDTFRFKQAQAEVFDEEWNYAHGRNEQRSCHILPVEQMLNPEVALPWRELNVLVKVVAQRQPKGKELSTQTRYYIASAKDQPAKARYFNSLVRGHWGIENNLHWQLDMTFREDYATVKKGNGPQNLSALRKIALQRLANANDKLSMPKRRFRAALNLVYLEEILKI